MLLVVSNLIKNNLPQYCPMPIYQNLVCNWIQIVLIYLCHHLMPIGVLRPLIQTLEMWGKKDKYLGFTVYCLIN